MHRAHHAPPAAPRAHAGRSRQMGAIGVLAAITLLMAVALAGLSIDTGRLFLERRAIQRTADVAALTAARFIGCGTRDQDGINAAVDIATRQGIAAGDVKVEYGTLGRGVDNTQQFIQVGTSETALAVRVTVKKTVPKSIVLRGFDDGDVEVVATAAAKGNSPVASFSINSVYGVTQSLADATSGLMGAILGTSNLNISPASMEALLKETVSLGELMAAAPQYTTVEQLLDAPYTLAGMLNLFASANSNIASNEAFQKITSAANGRPNLQLALSQVLSIYRPVSAGIKEARLNMLDLVITGVQVGGVNGGGLFNYNLTRGSSIFKFEVRMFNAPKLAVGPAGRANNGAWCTTAQSSQSSLRIGVDLSSLLGLADFMLRVDTSSVEGHMKTLTVEPGKINGVVTSQTSAITVVLTNSKDVDKPIFPESNFGPAKVLGGLFGLKIYQQLFAGANTDKSFLDTNAKLGLPLPIQLGAGSLGSSIAGVLGNQSNIEVTLFFGLIKLPLGFLDDLVLLVLTPLGELIDGTLALFGIQTGSVYLQLRTVDVLPPGLVR